MKKCPDRKKSPGGPPGDFLKIEEMFIMHILTPQKSEKWFQMAIRVSNRKFATVFGFWMIYSTHSPEST